MAVVIFTLANPAETEKGKAYQDFLAKAMEEHDTFMRRFREFQGKRKEEFLDSVEKNFVLKSEHLALLREMGFKVFEQTDVVSLGVNGKRPFGNSDWVKDIYRILEPHGWQPTYDSEGIDEASVAKASYIMAELPHAIMAVIKSVSSSDELEFLVKKGLRTSDN